MLKSRRGDQFCILMVLVATLAPSLALGAEGSKAAPRLSSSSEAVIKLGGKALRTRPADARIVMPLISEIAAYDAAELEGDAGALTNASTSLSAAAGQLPALKREIRALVSRLHANGEAEQFDRLVVAKLRSARETELLSDLQDAGGATSLLSNANALLDAALKERGTTISILDRLGRFMVSDAQARKGPVRRWACSVLVYVTTLGTGSDFNYHACHN